MRRLPFSFERSRHAADFAVLLTGCFVVLKEHEILQQRTTTLGKTYTVHLNVAVTRIVETAHLCTPSMVLYTICGT